MLDYALQARIIKTSDSRLSDDNFTYKDWSLGVYDKSRNMCEDPILVYKKDLTNETHLMFFTKN